MSRRGMVFEGQKHRRGFDNWMTSPDVLERARKCLGTIDLDPASNLVAQQYIKAEEYCISPEDYNEYLSSLTHIDDHIHNLIPEDGLSTAWIGSIWCNPPYSAGNVDKFVDKYLEQVLNGNIKRALLLVNSQTDTRWYHKLLKHTTCYLLWKGRIKFLKVMGGQAHEKWEGEKSKAEGKGKIGNSPRYLNTLFYYDRHDDIEPFLTAFKDCGTFCQRIDG